MFRKIRLIIGSVVILLVCLSSCDGLFSFVEITADEDDESGTEEYAEESDAYYLEKLKTNEIYYDCDWFDDIESFDKITYIMCQHVTYTSDGDTDTWQTPETTCDLGTGDCEDFTFLFINIAYVQFDIECDAVFINRYLSILSTSRSVVNYEYSVNHAIVGYDGAYIETLECDSDNSLEYYDSVYVGYEYSFDEVFSNEDAL